MKRAKVTAALLFASVLAPVCVSAQTPDQSSREYRRQYYSEYYRWSIGVNAGISAAWGDLRSFGEKNRIGFLGGLRVGYQFTPTVGISISGQYGYNKLGATEHNMGRILDQMGFTHHAGNAQGYASYNDIYSKVDSWHIGLNADININNLISGNKNASRRWTVIASPGIYMQLFQPKVYLADGNNRYTGYELYNNWNFGLGGDVSVRYKASRSVDLSFRTGAVWIANEKFDGIRSARDIKNNGMGYMQLGLTWKIGQKHKKDHMMYAPTRRHVVMPVQAAKQEVVKEIVYQTKEVPVEKVKTVEIKVADLAMPLPTIHFERGNAVIDEVKYATQLQNIVASLKNAPTVKIQIWGYADHTGTDSINSEISTERAQALKDYLVNHGIDASRIVSVKGFGADPAKTGEEAYSEQARRAEILKD